MSSLAERYPNFNLFERHVGYDDFSSDILHRSGLCVWPNDLNRQNHFARVVRVLDADRSCIREAALAGATGGRRTAKSVGTTMLVGTASLSCGAVFCVVRIAAAARYAHQIDI